MSDVKWENMDKTQYFRKMLAMMLAMRTTLYPLQVVKTRLQFQNRSNRQYTGIIDAGRKIMRSEGFFGFYKGYPVSLLSVPAGFVYLTTLELSWQFLPKNMPTTLRDSLSGVCACGASQLWMVPIDVVSQHQQINRSSSTPRDQFKETFQLAKTIWSQEGVLGFYRGFWISLCTFGPQSAIFWSLFGICKKSTNKIKNEDLQVCVSAASASVLTNLLTTPLDTVRARYQLNKEPTTTRETFLKLWNSEKLPGLYKGYFARTLYGLLNSSPILLCYFWIRRSSQKRASS